MGNPGEREVARHPASRPRPKQEIAMFRIVTISLCSALSFAVSQVQSTASAEVQFNRDIRPILSDRCFACHGPDRNSKASELTELRLDVRESAVDYGAIEPGDADASELLARVSSDDPDERMPPDDSHKPRLNQQEIELLRRWIEQGAEYQKLWSLIPPQREKLPSVKKTEWAKSAIDQFVLARMESEGLRPSPAADRPTLVRRVTFDLTGLPPTLAEVEAFVNDPAPIEQAYEKVVDRLLASPHYGEQMAADWLQLARFADSNGYQNDFRRSMWPWRDWVISAFNGNMPFDRFTVQQMAGDLLPEPTQSQLIATGFHRNNRTVTEGGSIDEEWRVENNIDRVETTAATFLGLTMGCARCHDHKYDPITQKEFYQFYAFFNSIDEKGFYNETRGNVPPLIKTPSGEDEQRLAEFDAKIARAQEDSRDTLAKFDPQVFDWLDRLRAALTRESFPEPFLHLPLDGQLEAAPGSSSDPEVLAVRYPAGTPEWLEGLTGKSLRFLGTESSHLDLGESIHPDRDSAFSYSVWLRPEKGEGAIVSRMDDADSFRGWDTILLPDARLKVHLIHRWDGNAIAVITKSPISLDRWAHVGVTYDGSSRAAGITVFVNGQPAEVLVERDSLKETIVADQPVRIGRRSTGLFFKGAMAAFRWFNEELTADEMEQLIARDLAGPEGLDVDRWTKSRRTLLRSAVIGHADGEGEAAEQAVARLQEQREEFDAQIPTVMILKDRQTPRPTYLLKRGAYDAPDQSEELTPDVPAFLPPLPDKQSRNRLALARWLTDPKHPLVARVEVNRIWYRLFGRGIVKSSDNFGAQGDPPSHPKLLDWLAVEFVESGWDLKALQKKIVMSATYQQSADATPADFQRDPENLLLARGSRFRLSAEQVRDNALAVSGLLTMSIGGPSVKPYQPVGLWQELAGGAGEGDYVQSQGDDLFRRSLYTNRKRTVPHPTMSTFDAPSFEICQAKRAVTNTPLQALALLNDVTYVEAARGLAQRMIRKSADCPAERVRHGFRLATARGPTEKELKVMLLALDRHLITYESDAAAANELLKHGESPIGDAVGPAELAAYTIVAGVILNLDETITHE
jgi:hypothetical protein